MSEIVRISTNTPWEPVAAYSRAVRAGDFVAVSGTTATDERGSVVGIGQMYVQARQALTNVQAALERVGISIANVVRTRMYVTDIARFDEAARAHREFFAGSPPASSMVQVAALVHPHMLIEIEADAYAPQHARAASSDAASASSIRAAKKKATPSKQSRTKARSATKQRKRR